MVLAPSEAENTKCTGLERQLMGFTGPALFEMHGGHPDRSVSQKLGGEIEAVVRTK